MYPWTGLISYFTDGRYDYLPTKKYPQRAAFVAWSDSIIDGRSSLQGIYYEYTGVSGAQNLTVEWVVSYEDVKQEYYHYTATLSEAVPGLVVYRYYHVPDSKHNTRIGIQGGEGKAMYYSETKYFAGLEISFNTDAGTVESIKFYSDAIVFGSLAK